MKIGSFRLTALSRKALAIASLACCTNVSFAQDASIFITSFSYTTTNGTTLDFFNPDQNFFTNAQNGGGVFGTKTDQFDHNDYDAATAGVDLSNAQAAISTFDPQTFFATASTTRSNNPAGTPRNQATADAFQSGDFGLSGAGSVTFIIDYMLGVSKPAGGSLATDYASAVLNFNTSSAGRPGQSASDQLFSFNQLSGTSSKTGEFRVTVNLLEDQVASYTLEGVAQSFAVAVPEPQEWALLAAGFVALSGFVRRRRMQRL
jgi:hypothetical protein